MRLSVVSFASLGRCPLLSVSRFYVAAFLIHTIMLSAICLHYDDHGGNVRCVLEIA